MFLKQGFWEAQGSANDMCEEMIKRIRKITKEILDESRRSEPKAYDGLYKSLGTKGGETSVYMLEKGMKRKTRDLDQVKCVKDR
ncbi:hypothetical protein Lal_00022802 [Lupinus albus]|nr:hypothetical protein Lal_00022802 [Lupinus albus]